MKMFLAQLKRPTSYDFRRIRDKIEYVGERLKSGNLELIEIHLCNFMQTLTAAQEK